MAKIVRQSCLPAFLVLACAFALAIAMPAPPAHADDTRTVPLLMIVVEFEDGMGDPLARYDDSYDWHAMIFGSDDSLASYFLGNSGGAFTYAPARETSQADVDGNHNAADRTNDGIAHVALSSPHGAWGLVNEDSALAQEFGKIVLEAFDKASSYVDYDSFDTNGDDVLSPNELVVCVCVAGYDASALTEPSRSDIPLIWPHAGVLGNSGKANESRAHARIDSYISLAERLWFDDEPLENAQPEPLGILYHELGHDLGLPDLYALNPEHENGPWGAYVVDRLSIMDNGGWASIAPVYEDPDYRPMPFDAWCRYLLGWKAPRVVTESGSYQVSSQWSDAGYSSLLIPTSDPDQYFLVENRQPEGYDEAIASEYASGNPRGGIVIWHIDKGIYREYGIDNTVNDTTHRPAAMELYFEAAEGYGGFTTDWVVGSPVTDQPFYDSGACEANLGDFASWIRLPLYNDEYDEPSARYDSGISLQFPFSSNRDMMVNVQLDWQVVGTSTQDLPLDSQTLGALATEGGPLGNVACAALLNETACDVALVDVQSVQAGLPVGELDLATVYAMLPDDSTIASFDMTGRQLMDVLEQSLDTSWDCRSRLAAEGSLPQSAGRVVLAGGISYTVDWGAESGRRLSDVHIKGVAIDEGKTYAVAATKGVVDGYAPFDTLNQNVALLWGSPADALRSFVQTPNWETVANEAAGQKTYVEPPAPEPEPKPGEALRLPFWPIVLGAGAVFLVLLGVAVTVFTRR